MPSIAEQTQAIPGQPTRGDGGARPRLAYLLSRYPAISHTFFLHEVLGLRAIGLDVHVSSVNLPDRAIDTLPMLEAEEARQTFYLKQGSKAKHAARLLLLAAAHPAVVLRGLKALMRVSHLTARRRALWLAYLAEAIFLGAWMKARGLAHLHVHFGGPVASVGYLTSVAWNVPYSLTIHGPEELQDFTFYQMQEKLERASFVIAISDFAKSQLMQRLPVAQWPKLEVVRLGVVEDLLASRRLNDRSNNSEAAVRVICVGRLVPEKGQRILLESARELTARGMRLHVTLVGGGIEMVPLREYVASFGFQSCVTFAGPKSHPETLALLRDADIFVLPSFAEGIPVALMEAMACEVACLSTTIAGITELIRHNQDGLLVAPGNVDMLTKALALMISDRGLRERMGTAGRQRVLAHYRLRDNHIALADIFTTRLAAETVHA